MSKSNKKNIYNPLINKYGEGKPIICIVGSLHGNELVGKKVIEKITNNKISIKKGTLITIIANTKALKKKKRYIDDDLNRVFPGNKTGNFEERLAYKIFPILNKCDYVIDIHSTVTDTKDVVIVKKTNKGVARLIDIIKPKRVVLMPRSFGKGALINHCKSGVSLEYGRHLEKGTFDKSLRDIVKVLKYFNFLSDKFKVRFAESKTEYFKVYALQKKPANFVINKNIKNFKQIKKGDVLGTVKDRKIISTEAFYPIMFGQNSYEKHLGFKAKKVSSFFK